MRGFGDITGFQQSGVKNFRFADPITHDDLFKLAEKSINELEKNIDQDNYNFLLKLFDRAEIINITKLIYISCSAETINFEACSNVTSK